MKIKKARHNAATLINEKDDNTIIDGYVSAEQLYKNMIEAGKINLQSMYPKNEEMEKKELEIIQADSKNAEIIKEAFKKVGYKRDELIEDIYYSKSQNNKINELKLKINKLANELNTANEKNKDQLIASLRSEIDELKAIRNVN